MFFERKRTVAVYRLLAGETVSQDISYLVVHYDLLVETAVDFRHPNRLVTLYFSREHFLHAVRRQTSEASKLLEAGLCTIEAERMFHHSRCAKRIKSSEQVKVSCMANTAAAQSTTAG